MPTNDELGDLAKRFANDLDAAVKDQKPVQAAAARERILVDFLMATAKLCEAPIQRPLGIDTRGEIQVFGKKLDNTGAVAGYGEAFAAVLSQAAWRTGDRPSTSVLLPQNGWCYIAHQELERLMRGLADGRIVALS
jgi:hypothetical protein